eukprot:PhF_6_TR5739/c1_g4_i1/m.8461
MSLSHQHSESYEERDSKRTKRDAVTVVEPQITVEKYKEICNELLKTKAQLAELQLKHQVDLINCARHAEELNAKYDVIIKLKDEALKVKDEALKVKDEVLKVKDEVLKVKDEVLEVKDEYHKALMGSKFDCSVTRPIAFSEMTYVDEHNFLAINQIFDLKDQPKPTPTFYEDQAHKTIRRKGNMATIMTKYNFLEHCSR